MNDRHRINNNVISSHRMDVLIEQVINEYIGGVRYSNGGDEYYTREENIVSELSHYNLEGKIIYCNCDNPTISNFYKFFKKNFNDLCLSGLYATYYDENPRMYFFDGSREVSKAISSGRFQDNVGILKKCDVIITNPPFSNSMPVELIKMARKYGKHVIIVGPLSMAYQKEAFEMIKNNQLNMGYTSINSYDTIGNDVKKQPTAWYTTMDVKKPPFYTGLRYNDSDYVKYDNFDAIDVPDYRKIPDDYDGYMGVSPRFLRHLDRDQFDIITKLKPIINGKRKMEKYAIKRK